MNSVVLSGAAIKLYINNKPYNEVQQISYVLDYGEYSIYGIDSPHPQELAPTKSSIQGSITGVRIKHSGGIQAVDARPLIKDILAAPYISIRIHDRSSKEDLIFIQSAKITNQKVAIGAKGTVKLSFDFIGMLGFEPLDRA
jgi:hypothetical protein